MNLFTALRISFDLCRRGSLRERYWAVSHLLGHARRMKAPRLRQFRRVVRGGQIRFLTRRPKPVAGDTWDRAEAAARWLCRAQDATPDGGVSYGYFPTGETSGWDVSYPETTGYIIPTLLEYARKAGAPEIAARAIRMAHWEADVQMASGAVQGGKLCPPDRQTPAAFNTGMVLDGLSAAIREAADQRLFEAAKRAADFLVADLTTDGYFRTNGAFVTAEVVKTYNCLCGWALYRFGEDSGDERYRSAAVTAVAAALRKQRPNGWVADNCLTNADAPLLHTIGYTMQGMLEVGVLAGREDFVAAARRTADAVIATMARDGFLNGRFYDDWTPAAFSSCLTGSAQFAVVCYRLAEITGAQTYVSAADRAVDFLKAVQDVDSGDPGIDGAVAGSFPILGSYMTAGYPNWATKYLLDSLMAQAAAHGWRPAPKSAAETAGLSRAAPSPQESRSA